MVPTKEYVEQKFDEYNTLIFGGLLPPVPIVMSNAKTYLGRCTHAVRKSLLGRVKNSNFKIHISKYYDLPETEVDDTIIHEMIHYYIAYNHIADTSSHGIVFRQKMNEVNDRFGRHLTITHKGSITERAVSTPGKWHVVALLEFHDGRIGFKVLPKVAASIRYYMEHVSVSADVKRVRTVISREPVFDTYPASKALRVYFMEKEKLLTHVASAEELRMKSEELK